VNLVFLWGFFLKKIESFALFGRSRIETGPTEALSVIIREVVKTPEEKISMSACVLDNLFFLVFRLNFLLLSNYQLFHPTISLSNEAKNLYSYSFKLSKN